MTLRSAFNRLCLVSFWIVIASIPLGVLEFYSSELLGCHSTEIIPGVECGYGAINTAKELVLNTPIWLVFGPIVLLGYVINPQGSMVAHSNPPFIVFIGSLTTILILALVHLLGLIGRLVRRFFDTLRS
jgi:hypothetical protein